MRIRPTVPEDKLADPAPKQPLALTLGAAAVTLLVIVGVLAGPSAVSCFNSADGMGLCLRGKMADVGILPKPAPAEAPAAVAEPEVAIIEPQLDVTPPDATPAAPPADLIDATFGLLRAEPDGSVVIAGSGTPGSEVEVYSNDQLLGKATVEASGDWVLVPDAPIPPGGTELTLAEAGKTGRAAESFVVVINDDKTTEPLVVASTPGAASDVLQGLTPPPAGTTTDVAAVEPEPTPELAAAEPEPAVTEPPAASETPAPAPEPEVAAPESAVTPPPAADPAPEPTPAPVPAEPEIAAAPEAAPADTAAEPAIDAPEMAVAEADPTVPTPAEPAPALAAVPPTIDAIEIEGKRSFFAGAGPEGAVVRLYVDDLYIADATVADGRWLVEAGEVLTKPTQRIRVDLLKTGTAEVAARAEVNFVVDLPAEAPTPVAEAEPQSTPPAVETPLPAVEAPGPATPKPPVVDPKPNLPNTPAADGEKAAAIAMATDNTPPSPDADKSALADQRVAAAPVGTPEPPAPEPAPAAEPTPAPEPAAPQSSEQVTPPAPEPAPEPQVAVVSPPPEPTSPPAATPPAAPVQPAPVAEPTPAVPQPVPPAPEPTPPVQAPVAVAAATPEPAPLPETAATEDDVPTMVAVAVGDPEQERFASGKAIIRRGDNLWTIARRVYGAGIKYTTIYQANTGQIRDPDRIYPGQVFDLPDNAE